MEKQEIFLYDKYYSQYFAEDLEGHKKEFVEKIKDLEIRDDDVWVVTLPKCGTTWMQELVWLVLNDFDFETARNVHLEKRGPFLETDFYFNEDITRAFKPIEDLKSPRLIKTHLPLSALPRQLINGKGRIVYVYRNPSDALVSMFHHLRKAGHEMDITLDDSINNYIDSGLYANVVFDHVAEIRERLGDHRLFYTSYERMKNDLAQVIQDMCKFLNKPINDAQMEKMLKHLSFKEMQSNSKVQLDWTFNMLYKKLNVPREECNFIRKGKIDSYKEELKPETVSKLEKWIHQKLFERGLKLEDLVR